MESKERRSDKSTISESEGEMEFREGNSFSLKFLCDKDSLHKRYMRRLLFKYATTPMTSNDQRGHENPKCIQQWCVQ